MQQQQQQQQQTLEELRTKRAIEGRLFPVIELFGPVIQGEGAQVGVKTLFIRFGGCDYKCAKCDSLHAVNPMAVKKHARFMSAVDIIDTCLDLSEKTGVEWVTFSGGNPMMHHLDAVVSGLTNNQMWINVETQGTLTKDWLTGVDMVTVSPKAPGMGEKFDTEVLVNFLRHVVACGRPTCCLKIAVFNQIDFEFALQVGRLYDEIIPHHLQEGKFLSLGNPFPPVLSDELDLIENPGLEHEAEGELASFLLREYRSLSEDMLTDPRFKDWRFIPQLHVLVYGNESGR